MRFSHRPYRGGLLSCFRSPRTAPSFATANSGLSWAILGSSRRDEWPMLPENFILGKPRHGYRPAVP